MIDLSKLPPPNVVEELDFEVIVAAIKADVIERHPDAAAVLELESEPLTKLIEAFAWREMLLRARINAAARSTMLAYAAGADLDHLVVLLDVSRLPEESDDRLRERAQLAFEGWTTAGPTLSYVYHALSASAQVRDVSVSSPEPGRVVVTVLAEPIDGVAVAAPAQLLQTVSAHLNADEIRPLTDEVSVAAAAITTYSVRADLRIEAGPDAELVLANSKANLDAYSQRQYRLGRDITISGLHAALHVDGVSRVNLIAPAADIDVAADQAASCNDIDIRVTGVGI